MVYHGMKLAYYGMTEVLIPYGENLYLHDINSSYPFLALNDMIGLIYIYV